MEGEREEEKHRCEREIWLCCLPHTAPARTEPTTQACAPTRNQSGDLLLSERTSNQLSHTGQGSVPSLRMGEDLQGSGSCDLPTARVPSGLQFC